MIGNKNYTDSTELIKPKDVLFNLTVHASGDINIGEKIAGSIAYDICGQPFKDLKDMTVSVEMLEYSVPLPQAPVSSGKKHNAKQSITTLHPPVIIASQNLFSTGNVNEHEILSIGHHEHLFEISLPANMAPTGAEKPSGDTVNLIIYRIHAGLSSHCKTIASEYMCIARKC
ncbi:hypothetical protein HDU67_000902 [Dinochytrium kinnereticum]|nr:hypothetical protein HDU67_000902 [Dinochytrium kinnereticum]